jgi:putative ABC transport system permease protein
VPYGGFGQGVEIQAVDKPAPRPGERIGARYTAVSRDYLSTMQISLVKGRVFNSSDEQGSPSVIINQTLERQFWPNEDPIGQKLRFGDQHVVATVVGVVQDIKMFYVRAQAERQMYVPLAQFPSATFGFVVRTSADSPAMATAIRDAIWSVDRDQPVSSVEPLETLITIANAGNGVVTKLMVFFSVLAMFLGAIGIYGVMAHLVSQRTHEIGIRIALGATPSQVLRMVINHGLKLALIGISVGVLVALAATRALAAQLYQVTPYDPPTFIGVSLLFALVAFAACYLPSRRGTRVDPLVALRYE